MRELTTPLFTPCSVKDLRLPNRIVMSPMTRGFSPNGVPDEKVAAYYRRRAAGGTGLIITEGVGIDHPAAIGSDGLGDDDVPVMHGAEAIAGWRHVVDEVHAVGGRIAPQLWHQGVMRRDDMAGVPRSMRPSGIWGPVDRPTSMLPDYLAWAVTPTEPMSDSEVQDVIDAYARSAKVAADVGFDAIAIHGAHGYLLDTFLWGETNQRTDRWGGGRCERTRAPAEAIRAIRLAIGPHMPILFRFSQLKQQDFRGQLAANPAQLEEVLGPLADAGVDIFDASTRYFDRPEFPGSEMNLAGWAKKLTGKANMAVGGVGLSGALYQKDGARVGAVAPADNMPRLVERFERGEFDLVAVGRALLQDPSWAEKARLGIAFEGYDIVSRERLI